MEEVLHANIFFLITSVAVAVFAIITSFILWQVFKLVKTLRRIIERVEAGSEQIATDAAHVRQFVSGGGAASKMMAIILSAVSGNKRRDYTDED